MSLDRRQFLYLLGATLGTATLAGFNPAAFIEKIRFIQPTLYRVFIPCNPIHRITQTEEPEKYNYIIGETIPKKRFSWRKQVMIW